MGKERDWRRIALVEVQHVDGVLPPGWEHDSDGNWIRAVGGMYCFIDAALTWPPPRGENGHTWSVAGDDRMLGAGETEHRLAEGHEPFALDAMAACDAIVDGEIGRAHAQAAEARNALLRLLKHGGTP